MSPGRHATHRSSDTSPRTRPGRRPGQGFVPQQAAEPDTLIVGDSAIRDIRFSDIRREESELLKRDFTELLDTLDKLDIKSFISGPLPTVDRGMNTFSRLLRLNTWLSRVYNERGRNFTDNFNLFWGRKSFQNRQPPPKQVSAQDF
ncbi:hypothetical protein N1851_000052 [Merluccius polli]|uniref:Uncharacterized protein n=1 Tax=Merluccius polli TaxID=89951 RepID=A0AA47PA02_MERPO|nr:hypothetical protein N1851_000052 [Merluccius polli]